MKYIHRYLIAILLFISLISCELTDIDKIEPDYKIDPELNFSNAHNSEQALVGLYNKTLLSQGISLYNDSDHSRMSVELISSFGASQFDLNLLNPNAATLLHYSDPYIAINTANYVIKGVSAMDDDLFAGNRKAEILGEARFLRSFSFFRLLRSYGQHWDRNSDYGIVIHTEPNNEIIIKPRSNVQETYNQILLDLDFAIANAPSFSTAVYVSKEAAQAFKARVLLYYGGNAAYTEAANLCDAVINSGNFSWEVSYADIFTKTYSSSESILVNHWDGSERSNGNIKPIFYTIFYKVSPYYRNLMPINDPRRPFVIAPGNTVGKYKNSNIPGVFGSSATFYMRLAEVYLIKAECLARNGGSLTDAQSALDEVRARVGLPSTAAPNINQLLADIRKEKLLDLAFEDAEPWFDLVRYHILGDINISNFKPTIDVATNGVSQFILPIPPSSLRLSNGVVVQNPGYPVEN
ncbi:RagB/SusD family nutrient uptake outer membrane protein [Flavobacterium jejuense]|uniref:RagB/SusD family nutrient uptake outer membrane protein n=1 Tax=Flavobacterium jejuense TaxID=1544455 RepID=A0ABX0INC6_9FLAO|nr:RagB/SusD family nutrient uptake outer membrane protein [Flavobacterium jejuense]NHN25297.1 RagB/SusD family nutrient uptake outer membrane protein [Flavobacterium jejuense]